MDQNKDKLCYSTQQAEVLIVPNPLHESLASPFPCCMRLQEMRTSTVSRSVAAITRLLPNERAACARSLRTSPTSLSCTGGSYVFSGS